MVEPIVFDDAKQEEDYKPSFCDASLPDLPPSLNHAPAIPDTGYAFATELPILRHTYPPSVETSETSRPSPKGPKVKPYEVALELMAKLPLRMVDNALYAFDGRVYRFVTEPVMNRVIMGNCRQYVHAVGDASIIDRIYKVIQAEPEIIFKPGRGDMGRFIADQDGLIDLETLTVLPHSPGLFVTTLLQGSFSKGSQENCTVFEQFLFDITGGDPLLIDRIWEVMGYALVPDTAGKCFILFQGVPDSGKSLLGDVIASLLDEENVTSLDLGALGERFGTAELVGKQLCLSLDMPSGVLDPKSTSMLKSLTGGDVVTADVKYQARIKFRCTATFLLASNHPLLPRDNDPALLGRAVTVPFHFQISRERQDHGLRTKILAERNAIIYRALLAYQRLRQNNYRFSGDFAPNQAISGTNGPATDLTSMLWDFLENSFVAAPGQFITSAEIYQAFFSRFGIAWPGGVAKFSGAVWPILEILHPQQVKKDRKRLHGTQKNAERGFYGIALVNSEEVSR